MMNAYKPPMTLRESERLLKAAADRDSQVAGWKAFSWLLLFLGIAGYLLVTFIQWLT